MKHGLKGNGLGMDYLQYYNSDHKYLKETINISNLNRKVLFKNLKAIDGYYNVNHFSSHGDSNISESNNIIGFLEKIFYNNIYLKVNNSNGFSLLIPDKKGVYFIHLFIDKKISIKVYKIRKEYLDLKKTHLDVFYEDDD